MTDVIKKSRILTGKIVSNKMQDTAVVAVSRLKKHSLYKKFYRVTKRYKVQNDHDVYHLGDMVLIKEVRPISKEKRWKVIGKAKK